MATIDSDDRAPDTGRPEYAGLLSFARFPYTEDIADLADVDVAVVGAPMDELTSGRPGARFGPREIRATIDSSDDWRST